MANYRGAILRYCSHIAGTCMFLELFFVSFSFTQSYEVSEAVDQWKMLALDRTPPDWKCNSRKGHPAVDEAWCCAEPKNCSGQSAILHFGQRVESLLGIFIWKCRSRTKLFR